MAKGFTPKEKDSTSLEEPKYNVLEETTIRFSVMHVENLFKDPSKKVN